MPAERASEKTRDGWSPLQRALTGYLAQHNGVWRGSHILFRHPGGHIPNSAGTDRNGLGRGIDVRGDGGFIVAPPSRHYLGGRYRLDPDYHPEDVELAPLPEWILENAKRKPRVAYHRPVIQCNGLNRWAGKKLDIASDNILGAINSEQESELNRQSYWIGRVAGAGTIPAQFALGVLLQCCEQGR